jgi:hypothetical protein
MDKEPLATMALREAQGLSADEAREVIDALLLIIRNPKSRAREKISASRVLSGFRRGSLDAIRTAATVEMHDFQERLAAIVERVDEARHS